MSWRWFVAFGITWIMVVVGTLIVSLVSAEQAGETGIAGEPGGVRIIIASLSGAIFGLPGVFLIIVGLQKRQTQNRLRNERTAGQE